VSKKLFKFLQYITLFFQNKIKMRPLTEEETKVVFEKLTKYIGENVKCLIDRPDGLYCFRLHKDRIYYVKEDIMKKATNIGRPNLISLGTCFGKYTKAGNFKLLITALDFLAPYAKYKVWVKPSSEQSYLYGHNVLKSGLGRITDNTPQYQGVVIYSMGDIPLGFGATARSTQQCRHADASDVVCFHQTDIGEYLRSENTLL
uniref:60S ribosome subunit biogenesis protein NIP7 homolog n=2 Tax=Clytia hemisphaerica TaxID=252671 RepID=A0A7M5WQ97_9CNID